MMSNESAIKKCADCGQTAYTSITCKNGKVGTINLFGVTLHPKGDQADDDDGGTIRKCKSMDTLDLDLCNNENVFIDHGYYSDEHDHSNGKKKGVAWTEKEDKLFLIGLEKLGKGDWRGISKKYVTSRTPTQVASHAQKYFKRINASQDPEKGKRRSSLFDMPANELIVAPIAPPPTPIAPTPTLMAPPTNFVLPLIPRTSRNYGVRDYSYMHMGYRMNNEKTSTEQHFSPMPSFLPVMGFPNQNCGYPCNGSWNPRVISRAPYVTQLPPITQGEPMIIEVIDDDK